MYCQKCGRDIPDSSNFCNYCGYEQQKNIYSSSNPVEIEPKKKQKKKPNMQ